MENKEASVGAIPIPDENVAKRKWQKTEQWFC